MTGNFYDKIVRKFGKDVPEAKHTAHYPEGDPEGVFEQKLLHTQAFACRDIVS